MAAVSDVQTESFTSFTDVSGDDPTERIKYLRRWAAMNLQRDQHAIPHLLASTSIYQDVAELRRSAQFLQSMKYERAAAAETETSEGPTPR